MYLYAPVLKFVTHLESMCANHPIIRDTTITEFERRVTTSVDNTQVDNHITCLFANMDSKG